MHSPRTKNLHCFIESACVDFLWFIKSHLNSKLSLHVRQLKVVSVVDSSVFLWWASFLCLLDSISEFDWKLQSSQSKFLRPCLLCLWVCKCVFDSNSESHLSQTKGVIDLALVFESLISFSRTVILLSCSPRNAVLIRFTYEIIIRFTQTHPSTMLNVVKKRPMATY